MREKEQRCIEVYREERKERKERKKRRRTEALHVADRTTWAFGLRHRPEPTSHRAY